MEAADEFEFFSDRSQCSTIERNTEKDKKSWLREQETLIAWSVNRDNGQSAEYNNIRQELYDSERAYLLYLLRVQKLFVNPLSIRQRLAKKSDIRSLFGEITSIYNINKELLYELRVSPSIPLAFSRLGPFLKLYTAYARNYSDSQRVFNKLMLRSEFRCFVEEQEKDEFCDGMKFSALMIMPVQRIPRYVLLLQRLYEETSSDEERLQLKVVLEQMNEITGLIESCIRDFENGERLWSVQESLGLKEDIVAPGRRILKEGSLFKRSHCGETTYQERIFWLFNDILVYGKRRLGLGPRYECSCIFPLRHCVLDYNEIDGSLLIKCKSHSVLVTSETYDTLKQWYEEIQTAVDRSKILRSTLRKESSRQQVKEFKSQLKKNFTKKFINKTYLYSMKSSRRRRTGQLDQTAGPSCSTDIGTLQLSGISEGPIPRKRKADTKFDCENVGINRPRFDDHTSTEYKTSLSSDFNVRSPLCSLDHQNGMLDGFDEPDRVPRTRSRARQEFRKQVVSGTLSHPEIRKYSYQEPSAPALSEDSSSTNSSFAEEQSYSDNQRERIPWWVSESTPAMYAKGKEKRNMLDTFRSSCSIM